MVWMVWSQLRRRGGRTVALLLAILVAAAGFTVLTASSEATRLASVGTVKAHARTLYDVLVRPAGGRTVLEKSKGLVQSDFLSGIYGGISMEQWRKIKSLPGIDVAAPIAMVGYVEPIVQVPVVVNAALPKRGDGVARVDVSWRMDNGLSVERQAPDFAYVTGGQLAFNEGGAPGSGVWLAHKADGSNPAICPDSIQQRGQSTRSRPSQFTCWSRTSGGTSAARLGMRRGEFGVAVNYPFPFVLAAVDPAEEDKLTGFDRARTSGQSLARAPVLDARTVSGQAVPVLAGQVAATSLTADITVSRVTGNAPAQVAAGSPAAALARLSHATVATRTLTSSQVYRQQLGLLASPRRTVRFLGNLFQYWSVSTPVYNERSRMLRPQIQPNTVVTHGVDYLTQAQAAPPGADDTALRAAVPSHLVPDIPGALPSFPPTLVLRGTFNPARLASLSDLTSQVLAGSANVPPVGADARSRRLLHGKPLAPSPNIGGLVQPPPLMITTLGALPQLTHGWEPSTAAAPISAIRVKVADVTGVDALSRERVRVAAQRITAATGLDVDITVGSSAGRQTIDLPAGSLGRPELSLSQWWVKKGVATAILKAVDKKSLVLFVLVLLVCSLSVANSAVASVRTRRRELGLLTCMGWRRRHLLEVVTGELGLVALGAGMAAAVLSLAAGQFIGTAVSWQRALLAIPAALLVALLAGLAPAWLAARANPMEAIRPAARPPQRPWTPRSVTGMGLANLARARARAGIAAAGLTVAVAAFTPLLAITLNFQGTVVTTLLGDAVAVQARGADYAAIIATLLLAGFGVANVLYLNIRDRGTEIATLRAVGWHERHLAQLVIVEATGIGVLGAVPGAAVGLAAAAVLTGITASVIIAAVLAASVGVALAVTASVVPVRMLSRLPTAVLLTEE